MSQSHSILTLSIAAAAAITALTFVDATGNVATAAGNALGVARSDAAIGDMIPVDTLGTTQVTASAAIAAGARIQVAAGGQAATYAAGKIVGIALEAAAAAGDVIEVFLIPN
jgi:hypothetical protein